MDALGDVGRLSTWSPLHKRMEVIDCYPDGRPHHVKATIKILGLVDKEVLEYRWGPDWMVMDADRTRQQRGQHVECNLKKEGVDKTQVRLDVTVEPGRPLPGFIVKRAADKILDSSVEGLTSLVMGSRGSGNGAQGSRLLR